MVRRTGFLAFIGLVVAAAPAQDAADYLERNQLVASGMAKYWQLQLPLAPRQTITNAYLVDDQIYAVTDDGFAYAIHARAGAIRWYKQVTTGGYALWAPCHSGDRTIFATPAEARQYDRHYGTAIRAIDFRFPAGAPPVSHAGLYFVGGTDNRVYAFRVDWGTVKDNLFGDYEVWKIATESRVLSRPAIFGDLLAFACDDGHVYGCRTSDKRGRWITSLGTSVTADLVADEKGVYVANRDNSLYLLEPATGKVSWRVRLSGPLYAPPVVTPDMVFQHSREDGLCAIKSATTFEGSRLQWKLPLATSLLTVAGDRGYFLSSDGTIVSASLATGEITHHIDAPGMTIPMPSPADSTIYLASRDGRIFCARPVGTPPLTAEDVQAAMRVAPVDHGPAASAASREPAAERRRDAGGPAVGGKSRVSKAYKGGE